MVSSVVAYMLGGLVIASVLYWLFTRPRRVHEAAAVATLEDMAALGEIIPDTIHPAIDLDLCIGSGGCVAVCPEKMVIGIVRGQAVLINPLACVGHSACVDACPVKAITLVFGSKERGVELPRLDANFQTTRPGVYVIGELGGMGLIRNAVLQGRQAAEHISSSGPRGTGDALDALVVGAGPAGVAATLGFLHAKRKVLMVERGALGGTIMHYPRAKVVMTGTLDFPLYGPVKRRKMSKEELIDLWGSIDKKTNLPTKTGITVNGLTKEADGMWRADTTDGPIRAANVLLALGRRGTPRKLEVPGEEQAKVHYSLLEPEPFEGKHVLVVGGGNSAVETALSLADFGRCASVAISYRKGAFARCRAENRRRIDEVIRAGKVKALMPTEVKSITETEVELAEGDRRERRQNDAVIVQIGGTAPSELLQAFGIEVVTKRGEA